MMSLTKMTEVASPQLGSKLIAHEFDAV
jgi:hypothetical protein